MKILSGLLGQAGMITRSLKRLAAANGNGVRPDSIGGRASLSRGDEGGALIEIALTVPILLGVLTGICTFGIAYSNPLTLTPGVGTAGQYLAQIRTTSTDPCSDVFTALKNAAPGLKSTSISLTTTMNGTAVTGTSCSGKETDLIQGGPVSVYATYPCSLSIYNLTFAGSCQLTAKVTEYEY
jgi:Flp pilus assembly protein TadG